MGLDGCRCWSHFHQSRDLAQHPYLLGFQEGGINVWALSPQYLMDTDHASPHAIFHSDKDKLTDPEGNGNPHHFRTQKCWGYGLAGEHMPAIREALGLIPRNRPLKLITPTNDNMIGVKFRTWDKQLRHLT